MRGRQGRGAAGSLVGSLPAVASCWVAAVPLHALALCRWSQELVLGRYRDYHLPVLPAGALSQLTRLRWAPQRPGTEAVGGLACVPSAPPAVKQQVVFFEPLRTLVHGLSPLFPLQDQRQRRADEAAPLVVRAAQPAGAALLAAGM